jgi:DNA-binding LacI/PurR family transcriptional regulator
MARKFINIFESLQKDILFGELPIGQVLLTEEELEEKYQCSRSPVRKALDQLEAMGFITRIRGSGSYAGKIRNHSKSHSKSVVLLLPNLGGPYHEFISAAADTIKKLPVCMFPLEHHYSLEGYVQCFEKIENALVDGVILVPPSNRSVMEEMLYKKAIERFKGKIVYAVRQGHNLGDANVWFDFSQATENVINECCMTELKSVIYIGDGSQSYDMNSTLESVGATCKKNKIDFDPSRHFISDYSLSTVHRLMYLLVGLPKPILTLCSQATSAVLIANLVEACHWRLGKDIYVAGFGNKDYYRTENGIGVSVLCHPHDVCGKTAMTKMVQLLTGKSSKKSFMKFEKVTGQYLRRGSCGIFDHEPTQYKKPIV